MLNSLVSLSKTLLKRISICIFDSWWAPKSIIDAKFTYVTNGGNKLKFMILQAIFITCDIIFDCILKVHIFTVIFVVGDLIWPRTASSYFPDAMINILIVIQGYKIKRNKWAHNSHKEDQIYTYKKKRIKSIYYGLWVGILYYRTKITSSGDKSLCRCSNMLCVTGNWRTCLDRWVGAYWKLIM